MKEQNIKLTQSQLESLVERYFECETTDDEEEQLRKELASTQWESPAIDEAKVTMGFMSVGLSLHNKKARKSRSVIVRRAISIAATVIVIFTLAIFTYNRINIERDTCVAYVADEKISNDDKVLGMIKNDLGDMHEASTGVNDKVQQQLGSIGDALDSEK
jgi:hypothetical protein